MNKEGGRSRRASHREDQDYRTRDVHNRRKNISKLEAMKFTALFLPDGVVGEYASQQMCKAIRSSISSLANHNPTEADIRLLEMGYQHLPDRWDTIQNYIHHPTSYSEELNDELIYLDRCYKVMGTGRR